MDGYRDEFDDARHLSHFDLDGMDLEAFRFARSWHRFPAVQEALWYDGVNLGEMAEHDLLEKIVGLLHQHRRGGGS